MAALSPERPAACCKPPHLLIRVDQHRRLLSRGQWIGAQRAPCRSTGQSCQPEVNGCCWAVDGNGGLARQARSANCRWQGAVCAGFSAGDAASVIAPACAIAQPASVAIAASPAAPCCAAPCSAPERPAIGQLAGRRWRLLARNRGAWDCSLPRQRCHQRCAIERPLRPALTAPPPKTRRSQTGLPLTSPPSCSSRSPNRWQAAAPRVGCQAPDQLPEPQLPRSGRWLFNSPHSRRCRTWRLDGALALALRLFGPCFDEVPGWGCRAAAAARPHSGPASRRPGHRAGPAGADPADGPDPRASPHHRRLAGGQASPSRSAAAASAAATHPDGAVERSRRGHGLAAFSSLPGLRCCAAFDSLLSAAPSLSRNGMAAPARVPIGTASCLDAVWSTGRCSHWLEASTTRGGGGCRAGCGDGNPGAFVWILQGDFQEKCRQIAQRTPFAITALLQLLIGVVRQGDGDASRAAEQRRGFVSGPSHKR